MKANRASRKRIVLSWLALAGVVSVPLAAAAASPLLAWRDPVYILAGFTGIIAMVLLLVQPLLAMGYMPGLHLRSARRAHRWIGASLLAAVVLHVGGLWITSPPDVLDALFFRSPTPFSAWGVVAMWAVFATAVLAAIRKKLRLRPPAWQFAHLSLAVVIVICCLVHAALIEGTMETITKVAVGTLTLAVLGRTLLDIKTRKARSRSV